MFKQSQNHLFHSFLAGLSNAMILLQVCKSTVDEDNAPLPSCKTTIELNNVIIRGRNCTVALINAPFH